MSIKITKTQSEWLVASARPVSVCANVKNGEVNRVGINGLKHDSIYTDLEHLQALWTATTEILQEIRAAQERTKSLEDKER